jgi:hypothetical protein
VNATYAEFKRVDNARVSRERDGKRGRELVSLLAAGLPVALALVAYTSLHLQTVRVGYQLEQSRRTLARLQEEHQRLLLRLATVTTPAKTAQFAQRMKFSPANPAQLYYIPPAEEKWTR